MGKIKLLFVLPTLNIGGAEKVTVNIINSLDVKIFDIHLIVIDNRYKNLETLINQNVNIKYLNIIKTRKAFLKLAKEILLLKPDIVFSSLNRTNILVLLINIIYRSFKVIIREPSMPSVQVRNGYMSSKMKFIIKLLYPFAERVIAQTEYMKRDIEMAYKIDAKKVIVASNPIDKVYIQKSICTEKNPFEEYRARINCVYVGRLSDEKNPLFLIEAFNKVIKEDKKFHLYIIGDGYLKEDVLITIKALRIEKNITMLGFKDNPYPYIKYADMVLLCSKWEGMPNVVIESMFLNTPVVSTLSTLALSDLVVHGQTGYLVKKYNIDDFSKAVLDFDQLECKFTDFEMFDFNKFFTSIKNL
ncbi:glycosyltransferase [Francisella sp. LA112445]|uniref:glycosyltransferase n=1 Tax=Francisella sp. LA112445 TaxID=1395624 RepID=UPI001788E5A1|nr:glycosyltransferase [Francisella sp. LA112445]QIW09669.1 glycosyltransferase [Francisella sp. LA112445]